MSQSYAQIDSIDDSASMLTGHIRDLEHSIALWSPYTSQYSSGAWVHSRLTQVLSRLNDHAHALRKTARAFEAREAQLKVLSENVSSIVMWNVGRYVPVLIGHYGPAIIGGLAIVFSLVAARRVNPGGPWDQVLHSFETRLPDMGQITSHPLVVATTAHLIAGADELVLGVLGIPPDSPKAPMSTHGDVAAGIISLSGLIGAKTIQETPVNVAQSSYNRVQGVQDYQDLISRIPRAQEEAPQIRIEYYKESETYVVYLGGTIDPGVEPGGEPWDMTSNLSAVAGLEAGSYLATVEVMRQAGISAQHNVVMVGHSQGGLIAAQVAASGDFPVTDVITVGAPIRHVQVPSPVTVVALEHREDVIPALSGVAAPAGHIIVTRSLYGHSPAPRGEVLPAHSLSRYIETAALLDKNAHGEARSTQERIASLTRGDATVTMWRANRLSG
jgi:predicted alpha/beta hydrolase family esterase